jgi:hypothetical protein
LNIEKEGLNQLIDDGTLSSAAFHLFFLRIRPAGTGKKSLRFEAMPPTAAARASDSGSARVAVAGCAPSRGGPAALEAWFGRRARAPQHHGERWTRSCDGTTARRI